MREAEEDEEYDDLILPTRSREVVEFYLGPKDGKQRLDLSKPELLRYMRK